MVNALRAEGHRVTILAFADSEPGASVEELVHLCDLVQTVPVLRSEGIDWSGRLRALASLKPFGVNRYASTQMRAAVVELLSVGSYDAVICDDVYQLLNILPCPVPVILNKHDFTFEIIDRFVERQRNPVKIVYGLVERSLMRRWESVACTEVHGTFVCSERDKGVLEKIAPKARVAVVANAIDTGSYEPSGEGDDSTIVYLGAMEWLPNQDAVRYFVAEIFPAIRKLVPNVRFLVVGRNPPSELVAECECPPHVRFTGEVEDIRPFLAHCAVCVVPLRIGSGTRLKILEAAAMGKVTVATTIGAEGLNLVDGEEIILADEPSKFAQAVAALLGDRGRRRLIGEASRRKVEREYGVHAVRCALRAALRQFDLDDGLAESYGQSAGES